MEEFAILHNTEPSQILVIKEYSDDDKAYKVSARVEIDGLILTPAAGFKTHEQANTAFNQFREVEFAKNFVNSVADGLFDEPIFK